MGHLTKPVAFIGVGRRVLAVLPMALLITMAGCGSDTKSAPPSSSSTATTTATSTQKWTSETVEQWGKRVHAAIDDLETAMGWMASAMRAEDYKGIAEACDHVGQAADRLAANLPAFNQQATASLQASVDDVRAAERVCKTFGPGSITDDKVNEFLADLNRATTRFPSS
jgi:uncharacterized protein YceK